MPIAIAALLPLAEKIFDKVFPDPAKAAEAKLKLIELEQKGELAFLEKDTSIALAQAAINLEEAKSPSFFKGGWRPYVAWVCAAGMTWAFVLQPILIFTLKAIGHPITDWPSIQTDILMGMLGGLLGLGSMRSYERYKGVERL